jgi:hypothetical protein
MIDTLQPDSRLLLAGATDQAEALTEDHGGRGEDLSKMWWVFAVRGGLALVFAAVLRFSAALLGTLFFDPVLLVCLSLLLGSYVFGNGVLLGVAGIFGQQHRVRLWELSSGESLFAIVLAGYVAFSLMMTSESLAWLAALHALGTGCFQAALAIKLRGHRTALALLSGAAVWSLGMGAVFLTHRHEELRTLAVWLSGFEVVFGAILLGVGVWLHRGGLVAAGGRPAEAGAIA